MSELPVLLRRLKELENEYENAYDWYEDIINSPIYKVGITYQTVTPESSEAGDFEDTGWEEEYEEASIYDIERKIREYGINQNDGNWWSSASPVHNKEYFEEMEEKYHNLHIKHLDDSPLSKEEYEFFNNKISPKKTSMNEKFEVSEYIITVKHDEGKKKIQTSASSEDVAKKKIMSAEGCPESAIISIKKV